VRGLFFFEVFDWDWRFYCEGWVVPLWFASLVFFFLPGRGDVMSLRFVGAGNGRATYCTSNWALLSLLGVTRLPFPFPFSSVVVLFQKVSVQWSQGVTPICLVEGPRFPLSTVVWLRFSLSKKVLGVPSLSRFFFFYVNLFWLREEQSLLAGAVGAFFSSGGPAQPASAGLRRSGD